jgi:multiple sugar transport system substrate-binding protein
MDGSRSRRDFLRLAAGAAAVAATGAGCNSGSDKPKSSGGAAKGGAKRERTLRIAQWGHFVPAYDQWFDNEYIKRWGEEHDVEVFVDHIPVLELAARADAEVTAQRGHDLFGFIWGPGVFEDHVLDHRDIVEEVEGKLGKTTPLVERSIFNPKTKRYFGFSDHWTPGPVHYRVDLWDQVQRGLRPNTWDDVLRAGPNLKAMDHPLGMGGAQEIDSNWLLIGLMHCFGASIQDEGANLVLNRPATIEAVKMGAEILRRGATDEVFSWDGSGNNRALASGRASFILNAISAIRAIETQDPELASKIQLLPVPQGPRGSLGPYVVGVYVIWKFAENAEAAKQFLVDLALNYREAFIRSDFYNLPSFPETIKDLPDLVANDARAKPAGKYALLAQATDWTTNVGHPGYTNAAVDEVFNQYLVPKMFAAAARGEMTAEDAVRAAEAQMKPIFDKWRGRGMI